MEEIEIDGIKYPFCYIARVVAELALPLSAQLNGIYLEDAQ